MTYIIAEIGVNHDGDVNRAMKLIDIAKLQGADAAKFQLFNAKTCKGPMRKVLEPLELMEIQHRALKQHCDDIGIDYLASVFDDDMLEFAVSLGVDALKIGSGELTNKPLLEEARSSGLEVILSTGMSTLDEIGEALDILGQEKMTLLHCVSAYPCAINDANLRCITKLREIFRVPVGYSDHTEGTMAACAAVALGACVIEKHMTDDFTRNGPDHRMSIEPAMFGAMVRAIRNTEAMLGDGEKVIGEHELSTRQRATGRWS